MKIFVAGAGGFIGQNLIKKLTQSTNHNIVALTRRKINFSAGKNIVGDILKSDKWKEELQSSDVVVNLCGNDIARKWPRSVKIELQNARLKTTEAIVRAMNSKQLLINASAVGYYGYSRDKTFDETSVSGKDYLALLAKDWELKALSAIEKKCRVVIMRLGVVLGNGGAIKNIVGQKFIGGRIGSGKQYFSWIHITDVLHFIKRAIDEDEFYGIYNICSPNPVCYDEFNASLGSILPRITTMKIPNMLLKMSVGEFAETLIQGQKVLPKRLQQLDFEFTFPYLKEALQDVLAKV
ncbi:TIGR01777 family oxidoreductase [Candidatus Uabimicrobium sp. HlEnr_7]|uniref:TIGR01777 family oxidoreductase n=1 Tax=Candidatus Uabimicrobium helgolandensis TaxID=3095367 RepID=UPI003556EEB7